MRKFSMAAVTTGIFLAFSAAAQAPPSPAASDVTPTRVRGTIEKVDGPTLTVQSRDGRQVTIGLASNFTVLGVAKRSLADIKAGDYVASTSVKGADGHLHALEIRIFPEAMRGVGEGQRPTDLVPNSRMTNATVSGVTVAPQGHVLKVSYKGGEAEVVVGPDTPIVTYVPGDLSLLTPGAAIFCIAQKRFDGSLTATRVTAEKDGVKPPM
jgi:hypothetical protein